MFARFRFAASFFVLCATQAIPSHRLLAQASPAEFSFCDVADGPAGPSEVRIAAVGVRATPTQGGELLPPTRTVLLIDTSASQAGTYLEQSLSIASAVFRHSRTDDTWQVAAVDVDTLPLTESFQPPQHSELELALTKLGNRPALGKTEFLAAIWHAANQLQGSGPSAVVYIGDGPAPSDVDSEEFIRLVHLLRERHTVVATVAVGPSVNWPILAAIASNTGGVMMIPPIGGDLELIGQQLANALTRPVLWTSSARVVSAKKGKATLLPAAPPPLRTDRDSIFIVHGEFSDLRLDLFFQSSADGQPTSLQIEQPPSSSDNAYLAELAANALPSQGVFLPLVGRESMNLSRTAIRQQAALLAVLAAQAKARGASGAAHRLAHASLRRDPDNPEANALSQAEILVAPAPEALSFPPSHGTNSSNPSVSGDTSGSTELEELAAMQRVRAQQLERDAAVRLREARQLLSSDAVLAKEKLKLIQQDVINSSDLDSASRQRLIAQLDSAIRESTVRAREQLDMSLASTRRAAIGMERLRLTNDLQRREEQFKRLTDKFSALVEEGIRSAYAQAENYPYSKIDEAVSAMDPPVSNFLEAERMAGEELAKAAPPIYASHPIPTTAREIGRTAPLVARIYQYDAQNFRTQRDQERGFMDVLHRVDVAGIPFVDDSPIIYPSPERWQALSMLREKWVSDDLAARDSPEKKIYEALEKPVSKWNFEDSPLRAVKSYVEDAYDIPVDIDERAFEIEGVDSDVKVSLKMNGNSLRSALRRLLNPIECTYIIRDEVLLITTQKAADEYFVVKAYDVADLVLPVNPVSGVNPFQSGGGMGGQGGVNSGQGMGGGGGMGLGGGNVGMMCWVARTVYGVHDPKWLDFRIWITNDAPSWLREFYAYHGESFSCWLQDRPVARDCLRLIMNGILAHNATARSTEALLQVGGAKLLASEKTSSSHRQRDDEPRSHATEFTESNPRDTHVNSKEGSLPAEVIESSDLAAAVREYLTTKSGAEGEVLTPSDLGHRLLQMRSSVLALGRNGDFDRAAVLISAAIAAGHPEPWMYESLAIAFQAAGSSENAVRRALLSAADFASSEEHLVQLANYLASNGFGEDAISLCRRIVRTNPTNREAYALALALASPSRDTSTLRWACAGVLAHDWPASQQEIAVRAGRLAKATVNDLRKSGETSEADAFQSAVDAALVRDFVVDVSWTGNADIDVFVQEPPGTICSLVTPRTAAGGSLLADGEAGDGQTIQRERYVAAWAFAGDYQILLRRSAGRVAADTATVEMTIHRGTDREEVIRRQVRISDEDQLLAVHLPDGRRTESLVDAQLANDIAVGQSIGKTILAQQLADIADPAVGLSRSSWPDYSGVTRPTLVEKESRPFSGASSVGYQPIITTLPEGLNFAGQVVVQKDRRYVRVTAAPLFSVIGQVTQFEFASGGGGGGMGQGGMGQGGMGQGDMGQGGMGQGGMGQGGMGQGGMGQGGMGQGGMGQGGMGQCWVAREIYGVADSRWILFRSWLQTTAPTWLHDLYTAHGEAFAVWIHDRPAMKTVLRFLMDFAIADSVATARH